MVDRRNNIFYDIPEPFEFLFDQYRYKVAYGGRGGGRSWTFARALLWKGLKKKLLVLCCREIQKSIADSVHRLLADQIQKMKLGHEYEVQRNNIKAYRSGTEFIFEGLASNVTKIKSIEGIDVVWVEEAEKVSEDSWSILIPTVRKMGSEIWVTFNPDQESDPTYQRFVIHPPPNSKVVKTSWRDNPWFPEVLRREMEYDFSVDPEKAAWIWEGECRTQTEAQVLHGKWTVQDFEPGVNWHGPYYGADWGFARDPTTLIRFWIQPLDDVYWNLMVEYEAYGVGVDITDTPELFDVVPGSREAIIRADSARPETINHMVRSGFQVVGAPKWAGCAEDGVAWIRGAKQVVIHPRCEHTIIEAKNWSYKLDKLTGDVKQPAQLEKGWDHCWDAIRYGATPMIVSDQDETIVYDDHVNISPF